MISIEYPVETINDVIVNTFATALNFDIEGTREDAKISKISRVSNNVLEVTTLTDLSSLNMEFGDKITLLTNQYNDSFPLVAVLNDFKFQVSINSSIYRKDDGNGTTEIGIAQILQEWKIEVLPIQVNEIFLRLIKQPFVATSFKTEFKVRINTLSDSLRFINETEREDVVQFQLLFRERHLKEDADVKLKDIWQDIDGNEFRLNDGSFNNSQDVAGEPIYIINSTLEAKNIVTTYNKFFSDQIIPEVSGDYKTHAVFMMNLENAKVDEIPAVKLSFSAVISDVNNENKQTVLVPENWNEIEIITGIYKLDLSELDLKDGELLEIITEFFETDGEYDPAEYDNDDYLT